MTEFTSAQVVLVLGTIAPSTKIVSDKAKNQSDGVKANWLPSMPEANTMPSYPMRTSIMSVTPASAQALTSFSLIAREALAMSMVFSPKPSQKRFNPDEDPPDSTTGVGKSKFSPKASATIEAYGNTVDEPATCTLSRAYAEPASAQTVSVEIVVFAIDITSSPRWIAPGLDEARSILI